MAHQLDFHVTLWSDDQLQLLVLEKLLQAFDAEGAPKLIKELKVELLINYLRLYEPLLTDIDVHSIDINWDDEEDPLERQARLELPGLVGMAYLDPYKYDDAQANEIESEWAIEPNHERVEYIRTLLHNYIRTLLHNADQSTDFWELDYDAEEEDGHDTPTG